MWFQFRLVLKSKGPICLVDSSLDISVNVICGGEQAGGEGRPWPSVDGIRPFSRARRCLSLPVVPQTALDVWWFTLKIDLHLWGWWEKQMGAVSFSQCPYPGSAKGVQAEGSLPLQAVSTLTSLSQPHACLFRVGLGTPLRGPLGPAAQLTPLGTFPPNSP